MVSKDSPRLRLWKKDLVRCYQCNGTNHYAKDCSTKKKKLKELSIDKKTGSSSKKNWSSDLIEEGEQQLASTNSESDGYNRSEERNEIHFIDMYEEPQDVIQTLISI